MMQKKMRNYFYHSCFLALLFLNFSCAQKVIYRYEHVNNRTPGGGYLYNYHNYQTPPPRAPYARPYSRAYQNPYEDSPYSDLDAYAVPYYHNDNDVSEMEFGPDDKQ